jgi:hypothetical protein
MRRERVDDGDQQVHVQDRVAATASAGDRRAAPRF